MNSLLHLMWVSAGLTIQVLKFVISKLSAAKLRDFDSNLCCAWAFIFISEFFDVKVTMQAF